MEQKDYWPVIDLSTISAVKLRPSGLTKWEGQVLGRSAWDSQCRSSCEAAVIREPWQRPAESQV